MAILWEVLSPLGVGLQVPLTRGTPQAPLYEVPLSFSIPLHDPLKLLQLLEGKGPEDWQSLSNLYSQPVLWASQEVQEHRDFLLATQRDKHSVHEYLNDFSFNSLHISHVRWLRLGVLNVLFASDYNKSMLCNSENKMLRVFWELGGIIPGRAGSRWNSEVKIMIFTSISNIFTSLTSHDLPLFSLDTGKDTELDKGQEVWVHPGSSSN